MKGLWKSSGWLVMAAALSFGFASCSSDNDAVAEQQSVKPTGKYTMTVQVTKGDADTRALKLGEDETSVDAYWTQGEEVLVYQEKKVGDNFEDVLLGTLTAAASNDITTTLTGTLDEPVEDKPLYFYLHSKTVDYSTQNGTLASIAENQDYAWGRVYPYDATDNPNGFTISGNEVIVPNGALTLDSKQAIVKFTLLDAATDEALYVGSLTVTDEALNLSSQSNETPSFISGAPLTITPPDDASPTNELYVAISGLNKADKHSHLVLTATGADGNEYIYVKEYSAGASIYFTHGMYYTRTVKMKKGFTTFSENSVIKVGDLIRLTQEWDVNNHSWYLPAGKTGTLVRANIDGNKNVTEAANGAYYVIKYVYHDLEGDDDDYTFYFFDDKSMPVGKTSDGLVVKNVKNVSGAKPTCTIGVNGYCEVWNWKSEESLTLNPDPVSMYNFYYFPNEGVTLHGINANMQFIDGFVNLAPHGSNVSDPDVLSETSFTFSAPDNKKFVEIKMIFKDDEFNARFDSPNEWERIGNTLTFNPSQFSEVIINPFEDPNSPIRYQLAIQGIESIVFTLADDI